MVEKSFFGYKFLWFIPSHHLETVDNYNKENVITTKKITQLFQYIKHINSLSLTLH